MLKRLTILLIDRADGPVMWAWMAALIGFVLTARAGWAISDWLLPVAIIPLIAAAAVLVIAFLRRLLGQ